MKTGVKKRDNPYVCWGLTAFCVLLACILAFLLLSNLGKVFSALDWFCSALSPVLYGLAFGYLLCPLMNRVERVLRPRLERVLRRPRLAQRLARGAGIVVAEGAVILLVYAVIAMLLPELTSSVMMLVTELPGRYEAAATWANQVLADNPALADAVSAGMNYFETWLSTDLLPNAQNYLLSLTTSVVNMAYGTVNLIIGLVVSIYVLVSKDVFLGQSKKIVCAVLPARRANYLMEMARFAHKTFGGFLSGKILDSLIIGVLCFVGMSILRLPYTLLISVIVGVTNVIPFFGPYIGAVPSAFLILLVNPMQCLYFVIFILVLQQFDGNVLGPHILGGATGLSGFWVIVAILAFGKLFGLVGMVIGVPTFAVMYALAADLVNRGLRRRGIDPETDFNALSAVPEEETESAVK